MLNQEPALDRVFAALADPSRRSMVERMARGPAAVGELARPLEMSLPSVLQHLSVLEECGLVRSEKRGRQRICRLETERLAAAEKWIAARRRGWERSLDRLGAFLETDAAPKSDEKE